MSSGDNLFAIVLMFVILSGTLAFIVQPFFSRNIEREFENYYEETPLHILMGRKEAIYQSIKDLEFDFKTAKLSEEDYGELREKLESEAITILKAIDETKAPKTSSPLQSISQPSKKKTPRERNICPACGEPNLKDAGFCGGCGGALNKTACAECGHNYKPTDKFCRGCGASLGPAE